MNTDREWLKRMAEAEDGCDFRQVGIMDLIQERLPLIGRQLERAMAAEEETLP